MCHSQHRRVARIASLVCCFVFIIAAGCWSAGAGVYNIRDFGAKGNGKADDTAAIQAALNAAKTGPRGSVVVLGAGQYRVTKTLTVEGCLIKGLDVGGWPADKGPLPTLMVDFANGPCIQAKDSASVHGINFIYDHKNETARKFGPTVLLSGNGISLTNLRISEPYQGIMADGVTNIGRLNIENVFIISARDCGVYVTNTYDIATLRNVEVWNPAEYCLSNCVGFKLGRNDEIRLSNCFAFKCKIGYLFVKDKNGVTWGSMIGCSADYSVNGVTIEDADSLRISGGSFWAHSNSALVEGNGRVVISGAELKANGDAALITRNSGSLTVTGCSLCKSGKDWPTIPAARIESKGTVLINGCTFDDSGPGISIAENAVNFSITGNVFTPSKFESIIDHSSSTANKVIANNLVSKQTEVQ